MTILYFIIALGVLIFVHELGHFLLAKRAGVYVEQFSLGFGPKLLGFTWGETEYRLSLLPLGGYVKMRGEDPDEAPTHDERSFANKSLAARASVIIAGPLMNVVLCLLLLPTALMIGREEPVFIDNRPVLDQVLPQSAASIAGLKPNDLILTIDGANVQEWSEIPDLVHRSKGKPIQMEIDRQGNRQTLMATPTYNKGTERWMLGIQRNPADHMKTVFKKYPFGEAIQKGFQDTWSFAVMTMKAVKGLITTELSVKAVGGPVMIAKTSAAAAKSGLSNFLYFMGLLSINLAVMNLIPMPVLDGGHLLFLGIEGLIRRPVSPKVRQIAHQVGFALLVALMLTVTINDVKSLFIK